MKITVEISDALIRQAHKVAAREGVTLRNLVERGLHQVVAETERETPFSLRRVTFKGRGLQPDLRGAPWREIRNLAYCEIMGPKGRKSP